ncbi:hypothetical protein E2562_028803 [Oryza meyeriana var. granulata]|uniref:Uncharacterized protein n=1 Tax=Oryza meyeriana var. granulata TaxID=110450 RepID=A0A6G1EC21_9ORYZ|nr:hypothetical protein E2562_028803 [Oryza meyeriana var. granulata]
MSSYEEEEVGQEGRSQEDDKMKMRQIEEEGFVRKALYEGFTADERTGGGGTSVVFKWIAGGQQGSPAKPGREEDAKASSDLEVFDEVVNQMRKKTDEEDCRVDSLASGASMAPFNEARGDNVEHATDGSVNEESCRAIGLDVRSEVVHRPNVAMWIVNGMRRV